MRHKYRTDAFVLHRIPVGESSLLLALLSRELGLVYARAQAVRAKGAKLAHALQTLSHTHVTLTKGAMGWRLSGAVLLTQYGKDLGKDEREVLTKASTLLVSLAHGDLHDERLYALFNALAEKLSQGANKQAEIYEYATALGFLHIFGYLAHLHTTLEALFEKDSCAYIEEHKKDIVISINKGIVAAKS